MYKKIDISLVGADAVEAHHVMLRAPRDVTQRALVRTAKSYTGYSKFRHKKVVKKFNTYIIELIGVNVTIKVKFIDAN